jgi:hypothetical protein
LHLERRHRRQSTRSEILDEAGKYSEVTRPGRSSLDRSIEGDEEEEEIEYQWPPDVIDAFVRPVRPENILSEMVDLTIAPLDNHVLFDT